MNGSAKLRWFEAISTGPVLGHVLEPDPPQPEVDMEEGLQDRADHPVDGHHGPALAGDLVGALEIQGAVRRYPAVHEAVTGHSPSLGAAPCGARLERLPARSRWQHRRSGEKSPPSDSNREPRSYKDRALPIELGGQLVARAHRSACPDRWRWRSFEATLRPCPHATGVTSSGGARDRACFTSTGPAPPAPRGRQTHRWTCRRGT